RSRRGTRGFRFVPRREALVPRFGRRGSGEFRRLAIPVFPTISCINIRLVPQWLGPCRAIWYSASALLTATDDRPHPAPKACGGGDIWPMTAPSSSAKTASAPDSFFNATLSEADPEIAAAIKGELGRQRHE